ncbi:MAG: hypothetical protein AABX65_02725 [Nanoarchaeota archaeon]
MNRKGATPLSITLLVVLTIVLTVFTLYTFISGKVSKVTAISPELLDNIYQPQEQITFFMTSIAEEAYKVAKSKPLIPNTPIDKQPTLEEEFIKEFKERLGIGTPLVPLTPNYVYLKGNYISEQKKPLGISIEAFNNRLNFIYYEYLNEQAIGNIRAGKYIAGNIKDISPYCPTDIGSTKLTLPKDRKRIQISPDINLLALLCPALKKRTNQSPISSDAFIFAFPLSDNMRITQDGKVIFAAGYDYVVLIILDDKPPQVK